MLNVEKYFLKHMKNIVFIAAVLFSFSINAQIFEELKVYPKYEDYGYHPFFGEPYRSESSGGTLFVYKQTFSTGDINVFFEEVDRVLSPHGINFDLTRNQAMKMAIEDIDDIEYNEFYYMSNTLDDFYYLKIENGIIAFYVGFEK